eukprot:2917042-Rhodomonas_salina.2
MAFSGVGRDTLGHGLVEFAGADRQLIVFKQPQLPLAQQRQHQIDQAVQARARFRRLLILLTIHSLLPLKLRCRDLLQLRCHPLW